MHDTRGDESGAARKLVAIRASALLREGLKSALSAKGFDVDDKQAFSEPALQTDAELVICEVTPESEDLAARLLLELPDVALVFIGPVDGIDTVRRRNIRELSADVSVGEVVRVCQQQLFGTAPGSIPKPAASQTSSPFNVLPRPSDPPPSRPGQSVSSSPAPLLSGPPSSRPSGGSLSPPSMPPAAFTTFTRPSLSAGGQELSHELAQLLEDADRKVAQRMRPRLSLPPAPDPVGLESPLRLSPELRAALENPIGDYDAASPKEGLLTLPPRTQTTKSEPVSTRSESEASDSGEAKTSDALASESPPFTSSGIKGPETEGDSDSSALSPQSEPEVRGTPAVPSPARQTTARPPPLSANMDDDARRHAPTPKPRRPLTPLPPDPPLPKGSWLDSALGQQVFTDQHSADSAPASSDRPQGGSSMPQSSPTNSGAPAELRGGRSTDPQVITPRVGALAEEHRLRQDKSPVDTALTGAGTRGDPLELHQLELPPLGQGDGVRVLARAIRSRFSGAVAYEADGGIRRAVLKDGDLVTASSSVKAESLLAFLVERGRLEPEVSAQLEHKLPNFGRHAGAALIASGHIAQDQLWPVLRAHAEFVVGQALSLDHGLAAYESTVPERLQAEPSVFGGATGSEVLIEILRRIVPPELAIQRLGGLNLQLELGAHMNLLEECALPPVELAVLEWVPQATLGDLLSQSPSPEFSCVLLGLVELQVLRVKPGVTDASVQSAVSVRRDKADDEALRRAILLRKSVVEEGDYFAVLGIPRGATGYDVRRAYLELRRQFEPSLALTPATADLADDVEIILEVAEEAYTILHDPLKRERYRRAIESAPRDAHG